MKDKKRENKFLHVRNPPFEGPPIVGYSFNQQKKQKSIKKSI